MQLNHLAPIILNTELATMNQSNQSSIVNLPGGSERHHLCDGRGGGAR